jgi:hypothetical protein
MKKLTLKKKTLKNLRSVVGDKVKAGHATVVPLLFPFFATANCPGADSLIICYPDTTKC